LADVSGRLASRSNIRSAGSRVRSERVENGRIAAPDVGSTTPHPDPPPPGGSESSSPLPPGGGGSGWGGGSLPVPSHWWGRARVRGGSLPVPSPLVGEGRGGGRESSRPLPPGGGGLGWGGVFPSPPPWWGRVRVGGGAVQTSLSRHALRPRSHARDRDLRVLGLPTRAGVLGQLDRVKRRLGIMLPETLERVGRAGRAAVDLRDQRDGGDLPGGLRSCACWRACRR
jgi:hypothetical protein